MKSAPIDEPKTSRFASRLHARAREYRDQVAPEEVAAVAEEFLRFGDWQRTPLVAAGLYQSRIGTHPAKKEPRITARKSSILSNLGSLPNRRRLTVRGLPEFAPSKKTDQRLVLTIGHQSHIGIAFHHPIHFQGFEYSIKHLRIFSVFPQGFSNQLWWNRTSASELCGGLPFGSAGDNIHLFCACLANR